MTRDTQNNGLPKKSTEPSGEREDFDLRVEVLGEAIKKTRKEQNLTQEQLGKLIGVQKSQISKLEKNTKNVTLDTIQKVFKALKTSIKFNLNPDD